MTENGYGDFSSGAESFKTVRQTDVLLSAITKCQELVSELNLACVRIGELTRQLEFERDRKADLEYENRTLRAELQSMECRG